MIYRMSIFRDLYKTLKFSTENLLSTTNQTLLIIFSQRLCELFGHVDSVGNIMSDKLPRLI